MPSAQAIAFGKHHRFAECHGQALGKGRMFAECLAGGTRHSGHFCRVSESTALGKATTFAECLTLTLDKATIMVAHAVTATFLC